MEDLKQISNRGTSPHHNTFLIAAIIVAVLLVAAIFVAFIGKEAKAPSQKTVEPQLMVPEKTEPIILPSVAPPPVVPDAVVNPVQELKKTNPFEAETNPIEGAYKNPFE